MSHPNSDPSLEMLLELPESAAALDALRPALEAMPESRIQRRNTLDPSRAAETVLGRLAGLRRLRPQLVSRYGAACGEDVDRLPLLACATQRSEVELTLVARLTDLKPLAKEVVALHGVLLTDAQAMANRGALDPARLDTCRSLLGYRNQYHSLLALEALLRDAWPRVAGKTLLTLAELDRAKSVGERMMAALGLRAGSSAKAAASETRVRVLSLLVETYEEVRRNVSHLRWHEGDADGFAPSLWTAQRRRRVARARVQPSIAQPERIEQPVDAALSLAENSAFEA